LWVVVVGMVQISATSYNFNEAKPIVWLADSEKTLATPMEMKVEMKEAKISHLVGEDQIHMAREHLQLSIIAIKQMPVKLFLL